MVNQAIYIINAAAIFSRKISIQLFRFTDSLSRTIALNIGNQLIDSFQRFLILLLPVQIIRPSII